MTQNNLENKKALKTDVFFASAILTTVISFVFVIFMQKVYYLSEVASYGFVLILGMSYFVGDNISRKIK
jgi:hypothetical protein